MLGTFFIGLALFKYAQAGVGGSYEFFLLGLMLFIPGSYHSFIVSQIFLGVPGYSYDMVSTLEGDY